MCDLFYITKVSGRCKLYVHKVLENKPLSGYKVDADGA